MGTQNLVISFDYSWFLAKNLAYAECPIMKFHYRNSSSDDDHDLLWTHTYNRLRQLSNYFFWNLHKIWIEESINLNSVWFRWSCNIGWVTSICTSVLPSKSGFGTPSMPADCTDCRLDSKRFLLPTYLAIDDDRTVDIVTQESGAKSVEILFWRSSRVTNGNAVML